MVPFVAGMPFVSSAACSAVEVGASSVRGAEWPFARPLEVPFILKRGLITW